MARRTRSQRRWDAAQTVIAALALMLLGLALASGDISIGPLTIPQSLLMGVSLMIAGLLFGAAAFVRARRSPSDPRK